MTTSTQSGQVARLIHHGGTTPVLSCYLRLEPDDRSGHRYLHELNALTRSLEQTLEARCSSHQEREEVRQDLARLRDWAAEPGALPATRGVALFLAGEEGLFEVLPLPLVHQSQLFLDSHPVVRELVSAAQLAGRTVAVVLDRIHARFFLVDAFQAEEVGGMEMWAPAGGRFHSDRGDAPGWGERRFHNAEVEERRRHYAGIAQRLEDLVRADNADLVLLAGPADHTRALREALPERLARHVIGETRLNVTAATTAQVHAATLRAAGDFRRAEETALREALEESLGTGWAVAGVSETLRALDRGQVRTLLVGPQPGMAGFRCHRTGRLVRSPEECGDTGPAEPVADLAEAAIEQALEQGVEVVSVQQAETARVTDGLAALLRYR